MAMDNQLAVLRSAMSLLGVVIANTTTSIKNPKLAEHRSPLGPLSNNTSLPDAQSEPKAGLPWAEPIERPSLLKHWNSCASQHTVPVTSACASQSPDPGRCNGHSAAPSLGRSHLHGPGFSTCLAPRPWHHASPSHNGNPSPQFSHSSSRPVASTTSQVFVSHILPPLHASVPRHGSLGSGHGSVVADAASQSTSISMPQAKYTAFNQLPSSDATSNSPVHAIDGVSLSTFQSPL